MVYEYLILLGGCLAATLPLEVGLGVRVYREPGRLVLAVASTAVVFVAWDLLGAWLGLWGYLGARLVGVWFAGLPLEEYLFFVTVPICVILTYEAVVACLPGTERWLRARLARRGRRSR